MSFRYPHVRAEVRFAVDLLADEDRQREFWLEPNLQHRYWDLDWVINALFDTVVLPDPVLQVGVCLYESEVAPLLALSIVFDPLIQELGDAPDAEYMAHPTWPSVVRLAALAAAALKSGDDAEQPRADPPKARRADPVRPDPYADPHG